MGSRMRKENWDILLAELVESHRNTPFHRGTHDCCTFAADVVFAITGVDHMAGMRGTYSDESGAERILADRGGLRSILCTALGSEIPVLCAQRGDVLLSDHDGLWLCVGRQMVKPGRHGLVAGELRSASAAWRVK